MSLQIVPMSPERAQALYEAIQLLRDFRKEAALSAPVLTIAAPGAAAAIGVAIAFEPAAEAVLSLLFESVSVFEMHTDPEARRQAVAAAIQKNWLQKLQERFG